MKLFLVDDDPVARMIVVDELRNECHEISEMDSGAALLAAVDGESPDLILLDIEMPGMDGIAACRAWRAAGNDETQIIFVSAHDDLETRLAAYDAGGNDYIVKPIAVEDLRCKMRIAEETAKRQRVAAEQLNLARRAAFGAMSSMGEMGVLMEFLRASFACNTANELGGVLCNALKQFDLHGLVELRDGRETHRYSTQGACTELETAILGHVRTMERIFQFRNRLAINYPMITLLIPNLPLEDPDRVGRLRDHLAILAEGTEERFSVIRTEAWRAAQANAIVDVTRELTRTLDEIEKHQEAHRTQVMAIAHEQLLALTGTFVHLGLSESQERALTDLAQDGIDRISKLQDFSIETSRRLNDVTVRLKSIVDEGR